MQYFDFDRNPVPVACVLGPSMPEELQGGVGRGLRVCCRLAQHGAGHEGVQQDWKASARRCRALSGRGFESTSLGAPLVSGLFGAYSWPVFPPAHPLEGAAASVPAGAPPSASSGSACWGTTGRHSQYSGACGLSGFEVAVREEEGRGDPSPSSGSVKRQRIREAG